MNIFLSLSSVLSKVRGDVSNQALAPETTSLNDGAEDAILRTSYTHIQPRPLFTIIFRWVWFHYSHGEKEVCMDTLREHSYAKV